MEITGTPRLPADSLREVIETRPTSCSLFGLAPVCPLGFGRNERQLDLERLARDVVRLERYYQDRGFYGTEVVPRVEPLPDDGVAVRLRIDAGTRVTLGALEVEGAAAALSDAELRAAVPLDTGAPFRRDVYLATGDSLRALLHRRGHAYAQVRGDYALDLAAGRATARFLVQPGPAVRADTVRVLGAERLRREEVLRLLPPEPGQLVDRSGLQVAERRLAGLDIVNRAAVSLLPDRAAGGPADTVGVAVVVRVAEAPRFVTGVGVGYGSIDCLSAEARRVDRAFLGGLQRLELSARLARIGAGGPLDAGLEHSLCPGLRDAAFGDELEYRFAAELARPFAPGADDQLRGTLYARRVAELNAFRRDAAGLGAAWTRRPTPRLSVTAGARAERGRTEAVPVIACLGFEACLPAERERLRGARWTNLLRLEGTYGEQRPVRAGGVRLRGRAGANWATGLLLSDDRYLRLEAELVAIRELRPDLALAGRLLAGTLLAERTQIAWEPRFYAGGPFTVRGFEQNRLGPIAYALHEDEVLASPTGGDGLAVGSLELRWQRGPDLQWVAFVDAGRLWSDDTLPSVPPVRLTPGAGVRYATAVGPLRVDLAWNPYARPPGPLFRGDGDMLRLVDPVFAPPQRPWWDRLKIHFALAGAF